jgi:hypothetical protein
MEVLELVHVVVGKGLDEECPFPHYPSKPPKKKNNWTNSSGQLGTALDTEWKNGQKLYLPHLDKVKFGTGPSGRLNHTATYNPHHLIPGDASWPKTSLKKWMDEGHVEHDIGYNVNSYENGIDLPSSNEMRGNWTFRTPDFQNRYAFAAMQVDSQTRQFHDAHKAYSDFVVNVLEKIAARLEKIETDGGCGDPDCSMKGTKKKPFPTPVDLLPRVYGVSQRLSGYLWGNAKKWKKPLFTSRFALMYKNKRLTQEQAVEQLNPENFTY